MEYVQMTLNDWLEIKQKLKRELLGVKQSFVRIGYTLRTIEDQRLYENDGYKSVAEFARAEYGLEPSTTSRFMSINREYSVDGYSEKLRPEFEDFGRSQLEEMLKLPDGDREMIQPETSREDIRQLKKFNKSEPETGEADDIRQLVEKFYEENAEIRKEISKAPEFDIQSIKGFAEIVNPGGNRSYKKGLFFLMMYENRVTVKKFGSSPQNMTWWEFYTISRDVLNHMAAGAGEKELPDEEEIAPAQMHGEQPGTEQSAGGGETNADAGTGRETEKEPDINSLEKGNGGRSETNENVAPESAKNQEEEIAPAQKCGENPEKADREETGKTKQTEERNASSGMNPDVEEEKNTAPGMNTAMEGEGNSAPEIHTAMEGERNAVPEINPAVAAVPEEIPGQMEIVRDFPEYCTEGMENIPAGHDPVKHAYATRLLYMTGKGNEEASAYMAETMEKEIRKMKNVSFVVLTEKDFWEKFFGTEVDGEGREIECV